VAIYVPTAASCWQLLKWQQQYPKKYAPDVGILASEFNLVNLICRQHPTAPFTMEGINPGHSPHCRARRLLDRFEAELEGLPKQAVVSDTAASRIYLAERQISMQSRQLSGVLFIGEGVDFWQLLHCRGTCCLEHVMPPNDS